MNANDCTRAWMPCSARAPAQDQRRPAHGSQCLKDGWSCLAQQIRGAGPGLAVNLALAAFVSVPAPTHPGNLAPVLPCTLVPMCPSSLTAVPYDRAHTHRIQLAHGPPARRLAPP